MNVSAPIYQKLESIKMAPKRSAMQSCISSYVACSMDVSTLIYQKLHNVKMAFP